jgi:CheY-like chemotaxis protein
VNYKPTILVVDDSEAFAMYISLFLHRLGFDVVPTKNGAEALGLLKVMKPDIVVLDVAIQEINGITAPTLLSAIEHISNVPVILMYNEKNQKSLKKCMERRHFGCLTKPINILEFHKLIEQCITVQGSPRRKLLRAALNQEVFVTYEGGSHKYYAASISGGGIYIRSLDKLPVGAEVKISMKLKSKKPILLKGRVIYKKEVYTDVFKVISGVAIEFYDLNKRHINILRDYVVDLLVGDIMEEREDIFTIDEVKKSSSC